MTDKPLLFTADEILRPALESMYSSRPNSFQHINLREGVYWHPFLGFRGQATICASRLARLVKTCSLDAEGQDLREYVASEYDAVPSTDGTFAIGQASFVRTDTSKAGDIPKGAVLDRKATPTASVPLLASRYETLLPVHFSVGQATAGPIPIRARLEGSAANHPILTNPPPHGVTVTTPLFDRTITVDQFSAAGGSEKVDDPYVRRYARAYAIGQYGPTSDASRYGALAATGVRNLLVFDIPGTGVQQILVADSAWASSAQWTKTVQQSIYDQGLVGNGCKVAVGIIRNRVVTVSATVVLRDNNYASDTTEIDLAIREAVRAYFDDREDWNVWKSNTLKAVIAQAHDKIFHCSSATVIDLDGSVIGEIVAPDYTQEQLHLELANSAMNITYQGPT